MRSLSMYLRPLLALLSIQLLALINGVDSFQFSKFTSNTFAAARVSPPLYISYTREQYQKRGFTSRLYAKVTIKAFNATEFNSKLAGCSSENILVQLERITDRIAKVSRMKFSNGLTDSANPKSQMGTKRDRDGDFPTATHSSDSCTWMDNDDLQKIVAVFNDTIKSPSSSFLQSIMSSSEPLSLDLFAHAGSTGNENRMYSLTLFHVPCQISRLPSRRHHSGTILLYKPIYGRGVLESSINGRVIQREPLFIHSTLGEEEDQQTTGLLGSAAVGTGTGTTGTLLTRIGGPTRTLEWQPVKVGQNLRLDDSASASAQPSGFLELALYPPENAGYGNSELSLDASGELPMLVETTNGDPVFVTSLRPAMGEQLQELLASHSYESFLQQAYMKSQEEEEKKQEASSIASTSARYSFDDIRKRLGERVGGLDPQLNNIIRRLLASRRLSPARLQALGLTHVRGMLLYGPPGTGKTLIAREIARALRAREPKIVNGPEILDKFVGEAERNIRELFRDADEEWDRVGYRSELHVIILDELDSIAKKRGGAGGPSLLGDGAGVRDSVVNQLLSKIDGVVERNNVMVIGLTNRRDLIDPALLRPGRLEVQIEINPPSDSDGRKEILFILMRPMVVSRVLSITDAQRWAAEISTPTRTAGWSGADLAGLLRSAASFAIQRYEEVDVASQADKEMEISLCWRDFEDAFREAAPLKRVSKRVVAGEYLAQWRRRLLSYFTSTTTKKMKKGFRSLEDILAYRDPLD